MPVPRTGNPGSEADLFPEVRNITRPPVPALPDRVPEGEFPQVPPLAVADKRLLRVVTKYRKGALGGEGPELRCFMVCSGLQGYLSFFEGVQTEVEEIWLRFGEDVLNHNFLRRADGTIIDPTGSQFNARGARLPAVYIGPMPEFYLVRQVQKSGRKIRGRQKAAVPHPVKP